MGVMRILFNIPVRVSCLMTLTGYGFLPIIIYLNNSEIEIFSSYRGLTISLRDFILVYFSLLRCGKRE